MIATFCRNEIETVLRGEVRFIPRQALAQTPPTSICLLRLILGLRVEPNEAVVFCRSLRGQPPSVGYRLTGEIELLWP
jgi:hypothetical protein